MGGVRLFENHACIGLQENGHMIWFTGPPSKATFAKEGNISEPNYNAHFCCYCGFVDSAKSTELEKTVGCYCDSLSGIFPKRRFIEQHLLDGHAAEIADELVSTGLVRHLMSIYGCIDC